MLLANLRCAVDIDEPVNIAGDTFTVEEIRQALQHLAITTQESKD